MKTQQATKRRPTRPGARRLVSPAKTPAVAIPENAAYRLAASRRTAPASGANRPNGANVSAPYSLTLAFKLIAESDWASTAPARHANDYYPYALRYIDIVMGKTQDTGESSESISSLIATATKEQHGHVWTDADIAAMPELTGNTAFYIGYAANHLLMIGLMDKGGAR